MISASLRCVSDKIESPKLGLEGPTDQSHTSCRTRFIDKDPFFLCIFSFSRNVSGWGEEEKKPCSYGILYTFLLILLLELWKEISSNIVLFWGLFFHFLSFFSLIFWSSLSIEIFYSFNAIPAAHMFFSSFLALFQIVSNPLYLDESPHSLSLSKLVHPIPLSLYSSCHCNWSAFQSPS